MESVKLKLGFSGRTVLDDMKCQASSVAPSPR